MQNTERTTRLLDRYSEVCASRGMRLTPQRTEIYRLLASTTEHPSVETVWQRLQEKMPNVSLDTVYRAFHLFEQMGLLIRVECGFERARYDADTSVHHHFACTSCGAVLDIPSEDDSDLSVPAGAHELGRVESAHLVLKGVCNSCLQAKKTATDLHR